MENNPRFMPHVPMERTQGLGADETPSNGNGSGFDIPRIFTAAGEVTEEFYKARQAEKAAEDQKRLAQFFPQAQTPVTVGGLLKYATPFIVGLGLAYLWWGRK